MKIRITTSSKVNDGYFVPGVYTVLAIEISDKGTEYYCYCNPEIPIPDAVDSSSVAIVDNAIPPDWTIRSVTYHGEKQAVRISFKGWAEDTFFYWNLSEGDYASTMLGQDKLKEYDPEEYAKRQEYFTSWRHRVQPKP